MSTVDSRAEAAYGPLGRYANLVRELRQFRHGRDAQLCGDGLAMMLHRAFGNSEIARDLLVQLSANHVAEHFALTLCQSVKSRVYFLPPRSCIAFASIAGHRT